MRYTDILYYYFACLPGDSLEYVCISKEQGGVSGFHADTHKINATSVVDCQLTVDSMGSLIPVRKMLEQKPVFILHWMSTGFLIEIPLEWSRNL